MNTPRSTPVATLAAVGVLLVGLVGCRALPLPVEIDLLAELADASSGVVEETVRSGVTPHLVMDLPDHDDNCLEVPEDRLPVSIVHAHVAYAIDLRYEGPDLSGVVEIQPYLAPSRTTLWTEASVLGDRMTVDLASARASVAGVAKLTANQVTALNQGRLCWGLRLRATELAAAADGTIRASYDVRTLAVRAGVAVF
jgi:hypothetical protein